MCVILCAIVNAHVLGSNACMYVHLRNSTVQPCMMMMMMVDAAGRCSCYVRDLTNLCSAPHALLVQVWWDKY